MEPAGDLKTGLRAKGHLRPGPTAMGWGKKENPAHFLNFNGAMLF
jgi:hypothetical protein